MIINRIERRSIPPRALTESMTSIAQGVVVQAASTSEYTVDDTQTPTGDAGTLSALLNWIGHMVKAITGKANWRTAPDRTLAQCVDSAGLTVDRVPNASGARTLSDSPIAVSSGNVGIGITSSLTGKLHVKSTDATAAVRVENTYSGNGVDVSMVGGGSGVAVSHTGSGHGVQITKSSSGRAMNISHSGTGDGVRLVVTGSGIGLYVAANDGVVADLYRNYQASAPLLRIIEDNAFSSQDAVSIRVDGRGTGINLSRDNGTPDSSLVNILEDNASSNKDVVSVKGDGSGVVILTNAAGTGSAFKAQDNGTTFFELKDGKVIISSGGHRYNTATKSSAYTLTESDHIIFYDSAAASGNVTITLPSPTNKAGQHFILIDVGNNASVRNMILARSGSEKIDNVSGNKTFNTNKFRVEVTTNGTDWFTW